MLEQEAGNETTQIHTLRIQREVDVDEKSEMARKLNAAVDTFSGTTQTCTHAHTHTRKQAYTHTLTHTHTHMLTHTTPPLSLSVFLFRTHALMHTQWCAN